LKFSGRFFPGLTLLRLIHAPDSNWSMLLSY
jgi:hypothetical protein